MKTIERLRKKGWNIMEGKFWVVGIPYKYMFTRIRKDSSDSPSYTNNLSNIK